MEEKLSPINCSISWSVAMADKALLIDVRVGSVPRQSGLAMQFGGNVTGRDKTARRMELFAKTSLFLKGEGVHFLPTVVCACAAVSRVEKMSGHQER
jgi:hypothetical protein